MVQYNLSEVPKVELHLHLEGAIPHQTLLQLINKYDPDLGRGLAVDSLVSKFKYKDFLHFLELWSWKNSFIREAEDFSTISQAVAQHLKDQNIIYAEVFYSPPDFTSTGLGLSTITHAIREGLSKVNGIQVQLIADVVRGSDVSAAMGLVHELCDLKSAGVVGIGLGGNELAHPPGKYKPVYDLARANNFHTNGHAGESAGPESIWEALLELKPDRIGHGVRATEDPLLLKHLAQHQIPLEVCPVSNIKTGVYPQYNEHPVRKLYELGIPLSINSDDPAMFQTSLVSEFEGLRKQHGFNDTEIQKLTIDAIDHSFANPQQQEKLKTQITGYYNLVRD